ncbi:DinB family protein [Metaplanococcus flavidus]|uniref:DinB family protein n=1 Tax=Metaplanococcus flavidus TaxID=569883 RepID=A0ABW3L9D6_9BACL
MNEQFFRKALHGQEAHVDTATVFDGLDWRQAGEKATGFPHSVWELLFHVNYWQDFMLDLLNGDTPKSQNPDAESWPASPSPESEEEWDSAVAYFLKGLKEAEQEGGKDLTEQVVAGRGETRAECLQTIVLHNSYHAGQVVFARKIMGDWLPVTSGDKG